MKPKDTNEARRLLIASMRALGPQIPRAHWVEEGYHVGVVEFWLGLHNHFRRDLSRMRSRAEDLSGQTEIQAAELRRFRRQFTAAFLRFTALLGSHHRVEDRRIFPRFLERYPYLGPAIDLLEADHEKLEGLFFGVESALAAARAPIDPSRAMGDMVTAIRDLDEHLRRHLTDEEDVLAPIWLREVQ